MLKALFPIHHHFADFTFSFGSFPSIFCTFFQKRVIYVKTNLTKINRSVMYAFDSSCCRSHFYV